MVKKCAISYILILTLVVALVLSSTFLGLEDASADSAIQTISVGNSPSGIAFNPSNNDMYVTNSGSNTVSVIASSTNTNIQTIPVGSNPQGIAFNPSNNDMYVTNHGDGTVYAIASLTSPPITIAVGLNGPSGIAFNPSNNDMYVTTSGSNTVSVIAPTTAIQPPTHTTITSVVDGNGNPVQNGGSTVSTSITFQVTATAGTNPIASFECSLDVSPFSTCASIDPGTVTFSNLVAGQQHTFAVRAVDTQGNKDPNPATFSWTVLTPTQGIQKLINTINSFNLPKGVTTSLEAPLNAAITQFGHNNNVAACNQLNAFLNQVNAKQTSGQLTSQQAADLTQQAKAIQQAIGCSNIGGMLGQTNQLLNNVGPGDGGGDDNNDDNNP